MKFMYTRSKSSLLFLAFTLSVWVAEQHRPFFVVGEDRLFVIPFRHAPAPLFTSCSTVDNGQMARTCVVILG